MAENKTGQPDDRMETPISILIAVVTVVTAVVVWQASMLGSEAADAERGGLINTLKAEAAMGENLAYLYQQEADLARSHVLIQAQVEYLRKKAEEYGAVPGGEATAAVLNSEADALLLADQGTAATTPLVANSRYQRDDGTFDLAARLEDLTAENPDLAALAPTQDFARADQLYDHALYLGLTIIVFAVALFALTLAQITKRRIRWLFLVVGVVIAATALASAIGLELYFRQVA